MPSDLVRIESGVPIPPLKRPPMRGSGRPTKWPWELMDVGDSFFVPRYCSHDNCRKPGMSVMRVNGGKVLVQGSQWAIRDVVENGVAGVRVWRTA